MVPFSTSYCGAPIDQQMHHHLPDSIQQMTAMAGSSAEVPVVVDVK